MSQGIAVELEVPFHDVDALQVVWHGHYYKYLEIARTALMRSRDLDNDRFRELGLGLLMMETRCRHTGALRYGDRFRVRAWFQDVEQRIHVAYEIRNLTNGRRAARARTVLVTTDAEGALLLATPEPVLARLRD